MNASTALRLVGADTLPLLHRISTNALGDLSPGQVRATLFCDYRGRLIHRAVVGVTGDAAVWLLREDAPGAELAAYVERHIFRDDVRIEDRSSGLPVRMSTGGGRPAPGALTERNGVPVMVHVADGEVLSVGNDARAAAPRDREATERSRILAGRPAHGHEIVEAFTPFEAGLAHEVHLDKGCFTGQEVLMRLVTYRSVRRRLARVGGAGVPPATPSDLRVDGRPAGVLTSAVAEGDGWVGLAVVSNDVCESPQVLELPDGTTIGPPAPLARTRPLGRG